MNYSFPWHDFSFDFDYTLTLITNKLNHFCIQIKNYTVDTVEHLLIAIILYILICIILYLSVAKWRFRVFNQDIKNAKRVLFVIAHPDDECMFFGPVIRNFTRKNDCRVYLACLSTGQNKDMGPKRKKELYNSCKVLGIDDSSIIVHNHTNLPDSMDVRWPIEIVSQLILKHVETYDIDTLITFDRYGVSGHCNHYSIYYAVANLILEKKLPKNCMVYVLESVNILRKYALFLDITLSLILSRIRYAVSCKERSKISKAMKQHKSQLVWFRYLYINFSRYLFINTLQQMNLYDVELDLDIDD